MKRLIALMAVMLACAVFGSLALTGGLSSIPSQSAAGSVHPVGWGGTPKGYVPPVGAAPRVPTATMFDSVNVAEIPAHPFAAAGYTAGSWPTWAHIRVLAKHGVSIAIQASYHAECLDVEPGDATAAQAGPWVLSDIRAGFPKPCEYSDLSNMPAVAASDRAALGPDWRAKVLLWLAWYRGFPGLVQGYDAVQYSSTCLGRNLDCSTVSLKFLAAALPPYVAPKPKPPTPPAHTTTTPTPAPPPVPPANVRAKCWGKHATASSRTCRTVTRRHTWLLNHRDFWQHEYQQCIRHADGIRCEHAEHWWLLRRRQAIRLHARYS